MIIRKDPLGNILPPRVHFKSGRYYYFFEQRWTGLSRDRDTAFQQARELTGKGGHRVQQLESALRRVFDSRRRNAKARRIDFEIEIDHVVELAMRGRWCCAVTHIPFDLTCPAGRRRAPFMPSIDRIDSSKGYLPDNIRIVCLATNLALHEWGDTVLQQLAEGWLRAEFKRRVINKSQTLQISNHHRLYRC